VPELKRRLAELTQRLLGRGSGEARVRSAVVAVEWRGHGSGAAAAGTARHDTGAPMRPESQFHIASVAKPMTAVLIFQAVEEGLLGHAGIDARLIDTEVFPPEICHRLHSIDGVSYGDKISLRHLLTHTSGLRDAQIDDGETTSEGYGYQPAPNSVVGRRAADFRRHTEAIMAGRAPDAGLRTLKHWLPWDASRPHDAEAGLINYYLNNGCAEHALFRPGEGLRYSDTAFTILGLVAEKLLGASYHRLLRNRVFDPSQMHNTYLEAHSDLDPSPWVREVSDCWSGAVPMMSYGVDRSNDWGGGGVISSAADLNRFLIGLMSGHLFRRPDTLKQMLRWKQPALPSRYSNVGCGIFSYLTPAGHTLIGHSGAWGARMLATPDGALTLSGSVNMRGAEPHWMAHIADALLDGSSAQNPD
jgi:D-alanyl-D-alanine carboxypeptidase